ncbi:MAG: ARMT1-like domain-containing protein [Methanobacterium sp.]|nr:ARMT1-like domain-containing protein [Methanobacterium sp.]
MKVYYECAACFLRQAREALDMATTDDSLKMEVMEDITRCLGERFHRGAPSNQIGTGIHRKIKKKTGNDDPYHVQKEKCNQIAQRFLPAIEKILKEDKSLKNYLKAAITGNIIDFGALGLETDIEALITKTMQKDLAIDHSALLKGELLKAKQVLYLVDNIGEIVFDKLLIEKIKQYEVDVTVALKDKPILNDACLPDALEIGLDELAELTTIGTDSIGVIGHEFSPEFEEKFNKSDVIIAKGLGNYEGLDEMELNDKPVFCLLNAKCRPVALSIGVEIGDNVVFKLN